MILRNSEIDKFKWNACVINCHDPLFYFLFEIIEIATDYVWSGIQENDYDNIFPFAEKSKYGIKYLYTPNWIQRWGWLKPTNFQIPDYVLNKKWVNVYLQNCENPHLLECTNYVLPLNTCFQYNNNTKRNLKKALAGGFTVTQEASGIKDFIDFFKRNKGSELKNIGEGDYKRLESILEELNRKGILFEINVLKGSEVIAKGMFVGFGRRFTYFKGCVSKGAVGTGAGHLLLDFAIKFSQKKGYELFDFYGGNSLGIAQYYRGFGAQPERYFLFKKQRLPKVFALAKKVGL